MSCTVRIVQCTNLCKSRLARRRCFSKPCFKGIASRDSGRTAFPEGLFSPGTWFPDSWVYWLRTRSRLLVGQISPTDSARYPPLLVGMCLLQGICLSTVHGQSIFSKRLYTGKGRIITLQIMPCVLLLFYLDAYVLSKTLRLTRHAAIMAKAPQGTFSGSSTAPLHKSGSCRGGLIRQPFKPRHNQPLATCAPQSPDRSSCTVYSVARIG